MFFSIISFLYNFTFGYNLILHMKDWVYRKVSKKLPNASKVEKSFNKKTKGQKAKAANITQLGPLTDLTIVPNK